MPNEGVKINVRTHPSRRRLTLYKEPKMTVSSIASWWSGIQDADSEMNLGDIHTLWVGDDREIPLRFLTSKDRRMELDITKYPDAVPVAVAKAVLALRTTAKLSCIAASVAYNTLIFTKGIELSLWDLKPDSPGPEKE